MYGYCRLSRDEDKENYASIEEQKRIIQDYAISRNWTISDFYIDDNVSGYTFNRPAFSKMIEKVKVRKSRCSNSKGFIKNWKKQWTSISFNR